MRDVTYEFIQTLHAQSDKESGVDFYYSTYAFHMCVECDKTIYSQHRLISPRLIEHSRNITNFLGTGRPH